MMVDSRRVLPWRDGRTDDPIEALRGEGVQFDSVGRASGGSGGNLSGKASPQVTVSSKRQVLWRGLASALEEQSRLSTGACS